MNKPHVDIYSDGASRGNPGPGGFGAILVFETTSGIRHEKEISQGFITTTNNRMELLGVIVAFETLTMPCDVHVYTDSQYIVNAFNQHWIKSWVAKGWKNAQKKPVKNVDLWQRLLKAQSNHNVTYTWVKGHDGHEYNERCDTLATTAADGDNLLHDEVFERTEGDTSQPLF